MCCYQLAANVASDSDNKDYGVKRKRHTSRFTTPKTSSSLTGVAYRTTKPATHKNTFPNLSNKRNLPNKPNLHNKPKDYKHIIDSVVLQP